MSRSKSLAAGEVVEHAYIGFGSNLGSGRVNFSQAVRGLEERGYRVLRSSALYESEPWGGAEGGFFANAVLEVERRGEAWDCLRDLLAVESALGRTREYPLAPRRCDLDLLLWGDAVIDLPELIVPHPRLAIRNFVLIPLVELLPAGLHPRLNRTFAELLAASPDPLAVWPLQPSHIPPRA